MNKYEEALNKLVAIAGESPNAHNIKKEYNLLKELVNRSIPREPNNIQWSYGGPHGECPNCGAIVNSGQCCSRKDCRQVIDWSRV